MWLANCYVGDSAAVGYCNVCPPPFSRRTMQACASAQLLLFCLLPFCWLCLLLICLLLLLCLLRWQLLLIWHDPAVCCGLGGRVCLGGAAAAWTAACCSCCSPSASNHSKYSCSAAMSRCAEGVHLRCRRAAAKMPVVGKPDTTAP